jgi:cellulose synthase/poly-beta-1,6-N-acetylglucosamine synthase-like glycosyltransferase
MALVPASGGTSTLPRKGARTMAETPRISVIIPHLNEPDDLRRCLEALAGERGHGIGFEIIVVDNGSAVSPEAVTERFPGVRLEHQPVPGPGPARNRGAEVARADLLAFIDADCVAQPGWIAAIARFMDDHPEVDFVGGDIRILPAVPDRLTAIEAYEAIYSYRTRRYVERDGFAATGNMAVRRAVFEAVGPFGGIGTMEDTEWGQRATAAGHRSAYLAEARVATPSCRAFGELARRWDRHVAHEFGQLDHGRAGLLRWLLKAAVIAASPVGEIPTVLASDRVSGLGRRWLAWTCLWRCRLYRARRMLGLAWHDNAAAMVDMWNRERL